MNEVTMAKSSSFRQWLLKRDTQRVLIIVLFMIVPLTLLLLFTYIPFLKIIQFSFYNMKYIGERKFVGWANYKRVFQNKELFGSLLVSLYYMGGGVVQLALALLFATMFVFKVKGESVFKAALSVSDLWYCHRFYFQVFLLPRLCTGHDPAAVRDEAGKPAAVASEYKDQQYRPGSDLCMALYRPECDPVPGSHDECGFCPV